MPKFHGALTIENVERISDMILETLEGKKYTFSASNSSYSPDSPLYLAVKTSQSLESGTNASPVSIFYDAEDNSYAGFNFCDTYGVWGCSTSKHDFELKNGWDSTYRAPYIVIRYSDIRIVQLNGHGEILVWVISLED